MDLGRMTFGVSRLAVVLGLGLVAALTACAGKSENDRSEDGGDDGGTSGRGGTAGASATGGSTGKGGSTSNVVVKTITQRGVDKIDLLFMIDNSISMADKQRILVEAVPALVQRLVDPACVDPNGIPTGVTISAGCGADAVPEFTPIEDIHIGVITSSLGNHGGEVCVDQAEMPPRTLNDQAQLIASVRTGLYSYENQGFLVWDPRTGSDRPVPDPHPGIGARQQNVGELVMDFSTHLTAAGERGCGYESSLEAWYRFLVDPEPVAVITNDGAFSVRGPINQVVLAQRAAFMRPDSLLAIVMLTDENDCSINDEGNSQGWLVGTRSPMPRGSSECLRPDDPGAYACCRPCIVDIEGCPPVASDSECVKGTTLLTGEDSINLRCHKQVARFGLNLLYPWQRYVTGLTETRIALRDSTTVVTNPIYTPGADGTPAREQGLVFLAGIVGVPWQDLADDASQTGRGLRYLSAQEMVVASPNRWDVILGDPDSGRLPGDPFMIEQVGERISGASNPVPGVAATVIASNGTGTNPINGHESNIVNRDDLQYACIFDLVPDVPCDQINQDGCDCNVSEQAYNRPLCQYPGASMEGTQTHSKAYPGVRHLQVMKGFGDNAIVASICPKNVEASGSPATDPDYGYNPAMSAMISRFKEALAATCLPRPLAPDSAGDLACTVVEARLPDAGGCSCDSGTGRSDLTSEPITGAIEDELTAASLCGGNTGVSCSDYCMCEIEQLTGSARDTCQNSLVDPGDVYGYCYVDDRGNGNPEIVAACPATQKQIVRFVGPDLPSQRSIAFIACTGASQ